MPTMLVTLQKDQHFGTSMTLAFSGHHQQMLVIEDVRGRKWTRPFWFDDASRVRTAHQIARC